MSYLPNPKQIFKRINQNDGYSFFSSTDAPTLLKDSDPCHGVIVLLVMGAMRENDLSPLCFFRAALQAINIIQIFYQLLLRSLAISSNGSWFPDFAGKEGLDGYVVPAHEFKRAHICVAATAMSLRSSLPIELF